MTTAAGTDMANALLLALASVAFASMASVRVTDSMLPRLAHDFGREPAEAAGVITGFAFAYGVMQLVSGPIGDRFGKLRIISWAALAAAFASLLCALAPTLPLLTAARFVSGACCAGIIPLSLAWIGDTVGYDRRQETLARFATGTLLGLIMGQMLGGIAADTVGWRGAFVALALLFASFGWRLLSAARRSARLHPPAAAPTAGKGLLHGYSLVLGSRWARFVLASGFCEGALLFGALAFIPTWLHLRFGLSLSAAGSMVAAVGIGGLLYTSSARHWIRRLGERGLAATGGATIAIGFGVLVATDVAGFGGGRLMAAVVAGCLLAGFGFYMLHNTLQTLATQLAPQARGTALGTFAVSLFMGQSLGVFGVAAIAPHAGYPGTIGAAGLLLAALGTTLAVGLRRRQA